MRRAINGKLREESKDYHGYYKYEFDIREEDGSITKIPAYGIDMQDALSRIVKQERIKKVKNVVKLIPDWIFLISWFIYMGSIVGIGKYKESPMVIAIGLLLPFVVFLGLKIWSENNKSFKIKK